MISIRGLVSLATAMLLVSCGGGGGNPGTCLTCGSTPATTPVAANLQLNVSTLTVNNSGTDTITATALAVDANSATIAAVPMTLGLADPNGTATVSVTSTGGVSDATGKYVGVINIGSDHSNRGLTITATATGANGTKLTKTIGVLVIGTKITATLQPAVLPPNTAGSVKYLVVDGNNNKMPSLPITVTGPGGVQTAGTTDANGNYVYNYTSTSESQLVIRASAGGVENSQTVLIQAVPVVPVVTATVTSATASANPSSVHINTGGTTNQSLVRALFVGVGNVPIPNIRIRFDLAGDPNNVGGTLDSGTTLLYSDATGAVSTNYVPGIISSGKDKVLVRACWSKTDFAAGTCPNAAVVTLTVTDESVSVSIGTDKLIGEDSTKLRFVKRYVVQVVDSAGNPKPDVQISPSVDLLQYIKGHWIVGATQWILGTPYTVCDNEDLNRNGIADVYPNGLNEDFNASLNLTPGREALEPRKADVVIAPEIVGTSIRTDATGAVALTLSYPKNVASWVVFNINVTASVGGTESHAYFSGVLPVPADEVNDIKTTPSFVVSPYGVADGAPLSVLDPNDPAGLKRASLCTNPN
jgi:hypothetical protein